MEKLTKIKDYLSQKYLERENIIENLLISTIAGEHILLIGLPGTAKSELAREYAKMIDGGEYFEWLLTRYSTPDELFGPVKLDSLEQGIYERNTDHKLPHAHIAFLDEIFKANSAILNALLTLLNERIYHNNGGKVDSPLLSVIGASNEYPEEGEGLEALYDRFAIKHEVGYLGDHQNFFQLLKQNGSQNSIQPPAPLSLDDISDLQMELEFVDIDNEILNAIVNIREELKENGIEVSDRTFVKGLKMIKSKAVYHGRDQVSFNDLSILSDMLWDEPQQMDTVNDIVNDYAIDKVSHAIDSFRDQANSIYKECLKVLEDDQSSYEDQSHASLEANEKLKDISRELRELTVTHPHRSNEIVELDTKVKEVSQKLLAASFDQVKA